MCPAQPVPAAGGPDAAVVIDVLRATTTIAWALHNGAEAIEAFADLQPWRPPPRPGRPSGGCGPANAVASGWRDTTWAIRPWR
jgi:hypothetical protein